MAGHEMVVDHAGGLHESIDNGRADELEAARRQFLRDRDRDRRRGGHALGGLERVHLRLAANIAPQQLGEAGAFLHDLEIALRAGDGTLDLGAVAHDAGIVHQRLDLPGVVARNFRRLEIVERFAEIVALAQDGDPGKAGLETVEDQLLE